MAGAVGVVMDMSRWMGLLLVAPLLAGCLQGGSPDGGDDQPDPTTPTGKYPAVPAGSVRFAFTGDTGMGNDAQRAVAGVIDSVCVERGCQFVVIAGDLVYPVGVTSAVDPQFEEKFEEPFAGVDLPFWLVLGNHDNGGTGDGAEPEVGDFMVEYSHRTDRVSQRWNMPERYYTLRFGDVELFMLDSGPSEVAMDATWPAGSRGDVMAQWFAGAVAASDAAWKVSVAHHPYISNGQHRDAGAYDTIAGRGLAYKAMLDASMCGQVDLHLAGHDHDMQWLEPDSACDKTQFIISGAGGADTRTRSPFADNTARFEQYSTHGMTWIDVTGDTLTVAFYDEQGEALFEDRFVRDAGIRV